MSNFIVSTNPVYRFEPEKEDRIKTLLDNKLWIGDPAKFNDPFDVQLNISDEIEHGFGEREYKSAAKILFENYRSDTSHWIFNDEIIEKIRKWADGSSDIEISHIKSSIEHHIKQFGILCFSQGWNIPLSWSHYAQSHKGFCVEYEIDVWKLATKNQSKFSLEDVVYSNEFKSLCLSEIIFTPHKTLPRLLATKDKDWSYENERRLICFTQKDVAVDMPAGIRVKTIIAGCRASNSLKERLKEASQHLNVAYSEVAISKTQKVFELHEVFP